MDMHVFDIETNNNQAYSFRWSEDCEWYEATIIEAFDEGVEVIFNEYGNTDVCE